MIKKILNILILVCLNFFIFSNTSGQTIGSKADNPNIKRKINSSIIHFLDITPLGSKWEVTFTILGIADDATRLGIISDLKKDSRVYDCKIFYNRRCKMLIDEYYTALEIRDVLKKFSTDFDIETVFVNDSRPDIEAELKSIKNKYPVTYKPAPKEDWVYPESFPKFVDTGNTEKDNEIFSKAKQDWIEANPEDYYKMTGIEYLGESNRYKK